MLTALVFAVLWATGMVWRSPTIDLKSVTTAVIAGIIVAWLIYWLLDKFSGRSRG
jgi:F0F1-type ATP synthase assembly protein I